MNYYAIRLPIPENLETSKNTEPIIKGPYSNSKKAREVIKNNWPKRIFAGVWNRIPNPAGTLAGRTVIVEADRSEREHIKEQLSDEPF